MPEYTPVGFPVNVTETLAVQIAAAMGVDAATVLRRPLRPEDPHGAIGVWAEEWTPDEAAIGQNDPAISTYTYGIQSFVKVADEVEGRAQHAYLAKLVRWVLYRSAALQVALGSLSETDGVMTERCQRWGVRRQRFAANDVEGSFLYAATTEFWVQTETV